MKIILTTIYEGVDDQWLEWYCKNLEKSGMPDQIRAAKHLRKKEEYSFSSIDPTDPKCKATTTYSIEGN